MYEAQLTPREKKIDWLMHGSLCGLMLIGLAFVYSASSFSDPSSKIWLKQAIFYGVGIAGGLGACLVPYETLSRWASVGYWGSIFMLLMVLIFGASKFNAKRWIDFGFFQFQPSEFAKLAFIFMMAGYMSRPVDELRDPGLFVRALALTALPFILILKEPDLGSALIFFPICLVVMYVAGVPVRFLRQFMAGTLILISLIMVDVLFAPPNWQIKLPEYQRQRLLVYFGRDFAPRGADEAVKKKARELEQKQSYNVEQALISVGSGGLTGKGWRQGTQNALGYLPRAVAHNDFIFSVIAEEKGFLGSVTVITLYTLVFISGIKIASQARDRLGKLLAIGVVTMLFSHVFINIGMNIRLMPVTGIPLPLLSYGGSSVICSLVAIGILQNVYIYRRTY